MREKLINSKNIGIKAKPEFIGIFRKSSGFSKMNRNSRFSVQTPKINKHQKLIQN